MLKRPPQHRIDAPIVYVHPDDEAWDTDRVRAEQAEMREAGVDAKGHPFARYHGGWTRYDLDAGETVNGKPVTPREYLDESKQPTMWYLKRLSWPLWYEVQPMFERAVAAGERPFQAYLKACMHGLAKVENGPTIDIRPGGRLSVDDVTKLYELDQHLPYAIGEAVYQASMPLTEDEGKH